MKRVRYLLMIVWLAMAVAALYVYFFYPYLVGSSMQNIASASMLWAYGFYLLLGCLRGFTFVPSTYLILLGILFLPPLPLFILTMIGIIVSSAAIYYFSASLRLNEYFQRKKAKQINAIQSGLQQFGLPIIIGWSFFPVLPTDMVCYVSGIMKVNISKLLLGILIGEGICSAIYIFFGQSFFHILGISA